MNHQEKIQQERLIWIKRLSELEASGVTITQYAKAHSLSVHQIYYWKNKLNKTSTPAPPIQSTDTSKNLVKVVVEKKEASKIPDPKWLATFLKALYEVS